MITNNIKLAQQRWNMKILYVDGNIYMRQTLKTMLNSLGYQNLQAASDKFQAEEYLQKEKIEFIIADQYVNALDLLMTV
jgi:PleD family two-component response regulator